MRFNYTEIPNSQNPDQPFKRAFVRVRLQHNDKHKDVVARIDSGADFCLFHSDVGRMLGIDITAGRKWAFYGVSEGEEVAYAHTVHLIVPNLSGIDLEVGFADLESVGTGLLGQYGFFEQYQINFHLYKNFFEIIVPEDLQ